MSRLSLWSGALQTLRGSCLQDCEPGLTDFGCSEVPAPIALYDSIEACCAILAQLWVTPAYCITQSAGDFSYGWAVDYENKKYSEFIFFYYYVFIG